ncbi:MAG TPA: YHYH protein [Candidatus Dormibacteraeota bacterium]|nr:YHYH protein [Candidatus Dormibacteraeota bacterium]
MFSILITLVTAGVSVAQPQISDTPSFPVVQKAKALIGTNRVTITVTGGERVIQANGLPDHLPGQFPNRGNPNAISAQSYNFHTPTNPQAAAEPRHANGAWFGVALNGVPFEPGTAEFWNGQREWNYEAKSGFINLGLDQNNAHVQPTGAYHYHGLPTGLMAKLGGDSNRMLLVGYAADGFPIYTDVGHASPMDSKSPVRKLRASYRLKTGERPGGPGGKYDGKFPTDYEYVKGSGDLDECNGRFGVTPEYPQGIYQYYLTEQFPYISRSWRGKPDSSFMKRGPGPGGPGRRPGGGKGPGQSREQRPPSDFTPPNALLRHRVMPVPEVGENTENTH